MFRSIDHFPLLFDSEIHVREISPFGDMREECLDFLIIGTREIELVGVLLMKDL